MMDSRTGSDTLSPVASYAKGEAPALSAICEKLQAEIDRAVPKATSKIWHGSPVWFIGENPVVGYSVRSTRVDLMFWSGQLFDEPLLKPVGKDKAAQVSIRDESEIKLAELRRWLKKAQAIIFDYAGTYAKKRATAQSKSRKSV
jgi:hypothetical protein